MSRACSALESEPLYRSGDTIAPLLLPGFIKSLLRIPLGRKLFSRVLAPRGIYEYVIARTKYIDAAFEKALKDHFEQVLIFGAGFDTRALRFQNVLQNTSVFELDVAITQRAKIRQYRDRSLAIPPNLKFIEIDFDRDSLPDRLDKAGFQKGRRSLFILEGLLMYLQPSSVQSTFQTIQSCAGPGSRVVFDYVHASVLRRKASPERSESRCSKGAGRPEGAGHQEGSAIGESQILKTVSSAGEAWQFGMEKGEIEPFIAAFGFQLIDHRDASDLERTYFSASNGNVLARVNGTHCLVTAEKPA